MLKEIEELRKRCNRKIYGAYLLWILITVVFWIYEFGFGNRTLYRGSMTFMIGGLGLPVVLLSGNKQTSVYVDEFRNAFLNHLFDKRINLSFIEYGKGIDRYDMAEWGVIEEATRYYTRDLIEGNYLGTDFRMSFVNASKEHEIFAQNLYRPLEVQIFSGCYLMTKLKTPVKGKVFVSYDSLQVLTSQEKTFKSMFKVRCEDCTASEILSDDLKDKMMKITLEHSGAMFGVVDGWLHVAIPRYTSLAAPSLDSKVDPALIERMEKQMKEINELILLLCE